MKSREMGLDKFKGKHVRILDWTFFKDEKEEVNYRESYSIASSYNLIGTTITGDMLAIKDKTLVQIDHEEPTIENDFKLSKKLDLIEQLVDATLLVPEFEDCKDIKELKSIRKQIKACKKLAPKNLKDDFEQAVWDIEDEIDFLKD